MSYAVPERLPSLLPEDDAERQKIRLLDYMLNYFPDAHIAAAKHSYDSNIKHNGEEGMEWASDKSIGDGNQCMRHLLDALWSYRHGDMDSALYHLTAHKWRADELLQRFIKRMPPFDAPNTTDSGT